MDKVVKFPEAEKVTTTKEVKHTMTVNDNVFIHVANGVYLEVQRVVTSRNGFDLDELMELMTFYKSLTEARDEIQQRRANQQLIEEASRKFDETGKPASDEKPN